MKIHGFLFMFPGPDSGEERRPAGVPGRPRIPSHRGLGHLPGVPQREDQRLLEHHPTAADPGLHPQDLGQGPRQDHHRGRGPRENV